MSNQQNITLSARGLYTFPNKLGSAMPDGALSETNNIVIDRDGVMTPRRGFKIYGDVLGNSTDRAKQLIDYKYRILRHWSSTIDVDSNGTGTFTVMNDQDGTPASVLEPVAGFRIRYIEANGNLYFTSSQGIRKISCLDITTIASKEITPAGMVGALDGYALLNPTLGWFTADSTVAYRVFWGIKDENTNVIIGAPSQRIVIANSLENSLVGSFNRLINQLAIVAATPTIVRTGNTHTSTLIDNLSTTSDLSVGMIVSGSGVQANSTITIINSSTSITISKPTTTTLVGTSLTFDQKLHDSDYTSSIIPTNSNAQVLYNSLLNLTTKLDIDIGNQTAQVVSINTVAAANYQQSGVADYFTIFSALNAKEYAVWFQLIGATTGTIAPTVNNAELIQITVANTDTAAQVATKIAFALNTLGAFTAVDAGSTVTVTNNNFGITNSPVEYVLDAGFTVAVTTVGVSPEFTSITPTPASLPDVPTPTGELEQLSAYLDNIVTALNNTTGISTYAKTFINGSFSSPAGDLTTNVIFSVPDGITTENFYQIYRSAIFTSSSASTLEDISPDDELQLIQEGNPTSAEITAKQINFFDNVSDIIRQNGAYAQTNANSGEGILQAHTLPPLARDIAQYKVSTFFANITTNYSTTLSLLTASGLTGNTFTITQGTTVNTYTFTNSVQQIVQIGTIAGSLFANSGAADYFDIYDANNINHYRIWFSVGTSVAPSTGTATLVQCTLLASDTATQVALNIQNTLNNLQGLTSSSTGSTITVVNNDSGVSTAATENVTNVGFTISTTTSGTGESASLKHIGVYSSGTVSQNIDNTARSLVRIINQNPSEVVSAQYLSGDNDTPGQFSLTTKNVGDAVFYITTNSQAVSDKFDPSLNTIKSITSNTATNPTIITSTSHGLISGQTIIISGSNSTPSIDGTYIVTVVSANTFSIPVSVSVAGTSGGFILQSSAKAAENEVRPNRIFYSISQQPDAVPIVNFFDVGPKNKNILRILPLRNQLIILSEAGVYFLTGDDPTNFQVSLFDSSVWLRAPDSATVLNNQVFAFTTQGIATISDTGVTIISRPIENDLLPLLTTPYTNFETATFSVGYDSDRAFLLFTINNPSDVVATICYRFNVFTNTWTSWDVTKTCGVVDFLKDVMYVGAGDTNSIEVERKSFTRQDQADRENVLNITDNSLTGNILNLGALLNTQAGDVLVQTQYLTCSQLNRLLTKLDSDSSLNQHDYSTLNVTSGSNLRGTLTNLALKLDTDSGLSVHTYAASISGYSSSFVDTQLAFNVIVNLLNADPNIYSKTYRTSVGTTEYEILVSNVNTFNFQIILAYEVPLIVGPVVRFKQIPITIVWAPHHFGDPSMLKHVSESTILYENVNFTEASIGFSSDLSPGFDSYPIFGEGTGAFGSFTWGSNTWGGLESSRPTRTYIPVSKQRCRFINGQLTHNNAFELFSIYGISFTFSPISSRGYR